MFKRHIIFVWLLFLFKSCANTSHLQGDLEYRVGATLWMQNAGEYYALCHQAYNIARLRLDEAIHKKYNSGKSPKKLAIVLDIDETVLDNTPHEAWAILNEVSYTSEGFEEWVERKGARALPGAKKFLDYANSKRVEIFYISNRKIKGLDATYQNMVSLNLPVKRENIFLRTGRSGKESRRQDILKKYDIALLLGDNLIDFDNAFEDKTLNERNILVESFSADFGKKFIVFPNPLYGEWENLIYGNDFSKTGVQRARDRKKYLYPHR